MKRKPFSDKKHFNFFLSDNRDFLISKYIETYIAQSNRIYEIPKASSGGVLTEILCFLLESKQIDLALICGFAMEFPLKPKFVEASTVEQLINNAGSKYEFISFRSLFTLIKKNSDKKIAVICYPCFNTVLRKLQREKYPNIKYIFSFFCGYNNTSSAKEYLIKRSKVNPEDIHEINYRIGEYPGNFEIRLKNGQVIRYPKAVYEQVNIMFLRKGCSLCPYYTGEGSDISVGDAWIKKLKDFSTIITRTQQGEQIIRVMQQKKRINLFYLEINELIKMHKHNLIFKKFGFSPCMKILIRITNNVTFRRLAPFKLLLNISKLRRKFKIGISKANFTEVN